MDAQPELPRITAQIIRNNIARALADEIRDGPCLAWGVDEYFEMWGDGAFPWEAGGELMLHANSALSDEERNALTPLVDLLNVAWAETDDMLPDQFLQTEWPLRIKTLAAEAFSIMSVRGRFSETVEEAKPSCAF